jgi:hypothetical protein
VIVPFKQYMHDEWEELPEGGGSITDALQEAGVEITQELRQKMGRPFYEIRLNCTLDTETGEVEIVSVG